MEPLCIATTAGLKLPTSDSNPPSNQQMWEPAAIQDLRVDYHPINFLPGNLERSIKVQIRQVSMVSNLLHGMDGSYLPRKRSYISEDSEGERLVLKKRHK